jgi:hypothetical protein
MQWPQTPFQILLDILLVVIVIVGALNTDRIHRWLTSASSHAPNVSSFRPTLPSINPIPAPNR